MLIEARASFFTSALKQQSCPLAAFKQDKLRSASWSSPPVHDYFKLRSIPSHHLSRPW
jgi:hypothetical protein